MKSDSIEHVVIQILAKQMRVDAAEISRETRLVAKRYGDRIRRNAHQSAFGTMG